MQPQQVVLLPAPGPAKPSPIKIDQVDAPPGSEQDVVGIQIGMKHPAGMKPGNARTDRPPVHRARGTSAQTFRKGGNLRDLLGDQVRTVTEHPELHMGGHGARNRKSFGIQGCQQVPFSPGTTCGESKPQVTIADHFTHEATSAIMPQHPALTVGLNKEIRTASPGGGPEGPSAAVDVRVEQLQRRVRNQFGVEKNMIPADTNMTRLNLQ